MLRKLIACSHIALLSSAAMFGLTPTSGVAQTFPGPTGFICNPTIPGCPGFAGGPGGPSGPGPGGLGASASFGICPPQSSPMMPTSTNANGGFVFTIPFSQLCQTRFWFDPPMATGYDYTITGASFSSVTTPDEATVPNRGGYRVSRARSARHVTTTRITSGQTVEFPQPVNAFAINGIDPALGLSKTNPMAFPTGVTLANASGETITITQTPR